MTSPYLPPPRRLPSSRSVSRATDYKIFLNAFPRYEFDRLSGLDLDLCACLWIDAHACLPCDNFESPKPDELNAFGLLNSRRRQHRRILHKLEIPPFDDEPAFVGIEKLRSFFFLLKFSSCLLQQGIKFLGRYRFDEVVAKTGFRTPFTISFHSVAAYGYGVIWTQLPHFLH